MRIKKYGILFLLFNIFESFSSVHPEGSSSAANLKDQEQTLLRQGYEGQAPETPTPRRQRRLAAPPPEEEAMPTPRVSANPPMRQAPAQPTAIKPVHPDTSTSLSAIGVNPPDLKDTTVTPTPRRRRRVIPEPTIEPTSVVTQPEQVLEAPTPALHSLGEVGPRRRRRITPEVPVEPTPPEPTPTVTQPEPVPAEPTPAVAPEPAPALPSLGEVGPRKRRRRVPVEEPVISPEEQQERLAREQAEKAEKEAEEARERERLEKERAEKAEREAEEARAKKAQEEKEAEQQENSIAAALEQLTKLLQSRRFTQAAKELKTVQESIAAYTERFGRTRYIEPLIKQMQEMQEYLAKVQAQLAAFAKGQAELEKRPLSEDLSLIRRNLKQLDVIATQLRNDLKKGRQVDFASYFTTFELLLTTFEVARKKALAQKNNNAQKALQEAVTELGNYFEKKGIHSMVMPAATRANANKFNSLKSRYERLSEK